MSLLSKEEKLHKLSIVTSGMVSPIVSSGKSFAIVMVLDGYAVIVPWLCHGCALGALFVPWLHHGCALVVPFASFAFPAFPWSGARLSLAGGPGGEGGCVRGGG